MDPKTFRILSLDGGGIMGAFPASARATFEQALGKRILDHFDLITGTSTGGIIAIGLAMGATAGDVCRFYESEGPKIFPQPEWGHRFSGWVRRIRTVFRPKFEARPSGNKEDVNIEKIRIWIGTKVKADRGGGRVRGWSGRGRAAGRRAVPCRAGGLAARR
jgi:patatin-like phospholipase/acyl hydrolase